METRFLCLFDQVDYLIRKHNFRGGYAGAAGMGYELWTYIDGNAPKWFGEVETELVTELAMWQNDIGAEFADFSVKKRGSRIYLSSTLSSPLKAFEVANHLELKQDISRLLNFSEGMKLCYSDEWEPLTWDGKEWERFYVFFPEYEEEDFIDLSRTKSLQLARLVKKYISDYSAYRRVNSFRLYVFDDSASIKLDSVETKYEDISDSLKGLRPLA